MKRLIYTAAAASLGAGLPEAAAQSSGAPAPASKPEYRLSDFKSAETGNSRHEIGVGASLWFNARASMQAFGGNAYGPIAGDPVADSHQNRFYADGFNQVDALGNLTIEGLPPDQTFPRTSFFSFNSNSQVVAPVFDAAGALISPGSVTMHAFKSLQGGYGRFGGNNASPGAELFYRFRLLPKEKWSFDLEAGFSWMNLDWTQSGGITGQAEIVKDTYNTATVDVHVQPGGILPYPGLREPGPDDRPFFIGSTPTRTIYTTGATVAGHREMEMDAYLLRIGPAFTWRALPRLDVGLQAGGVVGWANSTLSYSDQITFADPAIPALSQTGRARHDEVIAGLYSGLRLSVHATDHLDFFAEGRHMLVDKVRISDSSRSGKIDLSSGFGAVLGVGYKF